MHGALFLCVSKYYQRCPPPGVRIFNWSYSSISGIRGVGVRGNLPYFAGMMFGVVCLLVTSVPDAAGIMSVGVIHLLVASAVTG